MSVFDGLSGSVCENERTLFINDRQNAVTFEKAVASFGKNLKVSRANGIVIDPPEFPEIDPIPQRKAIKRRPNTSSPVELNQFKFENH